MSSSSSMSISITICGFLKAYGLLHPLTVDGRQRLQHCIMAIMAREVYVGVSLCNGSVNSSLKCLWALFVRPYRSSTLSVVPSGPNFSRIGARVGSGGPCKRDGAPALTTFEKLRSVCLRRVNCRALYNATGQFSLFRDPFHSKRSTPSLRTSIHTGSCCSRPAFPTLHCTPRNG